MKYDDTTKDGMTKRLALSEGFKESDVGRNFIIVYHLDEERMTIFSKNVAVGDWFEGYYGKIYFKNKEECARFNKGKAQDYIGRCEKILKNI